jgi:hypothetical protein
MQVVAVDDGSTDGSGRTLDRFAARQPAAVTVVHTANSGGPAAPCNRGIELATGRYVFFLGADDHLAPFAMQRLVAAADQWRSDVVLGKVVGINGRFIYQDVFARTQPDLDMFESALPLSLGNTKLFRRDLIERHRLRYPEDMPLGSDQPFTIEACYRARRISVLADDDYYFAVRRLDDHNMSILNRPMQRLACAQRLVEFVADLVPAGRQRDALLTRHFRLELANLLDDDLCRLDTDTVQAVFSGVAGLARRFLTDEIRGRLDIEARLRLTVARDGSLPDLLAVIRHDAGCGTPPTVVVNGRRYAAYPGAGVRPEYDITDATAAWLARLHVTALRWERDALRVTARSPAPDLAARAGTTLALCAGEVRGAPVELTGNDTGVTVRTRFATADLLDGAGSGIRRSVRAGLVVDGERGEAPVRTPKLAGTRPVLRRRGGRFYLVAAVRGTSGQLMITVVPVTPHRVVALLRTRWPRRKVVAGAAWREIRRGGRQQAG